VWILVDMTDKTQHTDRRKLWQVQLSIKQGSTLFEVTLVNISIQTALRPAPRGEGAEVRPGQAGCHRRRSRSAAAAPAAARPRPNPALKYTLVPSVLLCRKTLSLRSEILAHV
jgi:hypothetical protein